MRLKYMDATVYAKQQPLPLIGDEHYKDGCVGITLTARATMGSLTYSDVVGMIEDLQNIATAMARQQA